jgi:hypothetical protein
MVHQGISRRVLRGATYDPGHWTFYFCRRGFGLVVSVVVPSMLAVLPYARGRGFDSRSRLLYLIIHRLCKDAPITPKRHAKHKFIPRYIQLLYIVVVCTLSFASVYRDLNIIFEPLQPIIENPLSPLVQLTKLNIVYDFDFLCTCKKFCFW